jgi:type IV secretion system protein TrbG
MKRMIILTVLTLLTGWIAPVSASNLTEAYFSSKNPQLTQQEREAIAMAKKWQANSAQGIKPVAGTDGSIRFLFGAQQPSIVCAVLQVCDIELQPGEQVNSIHLAHLSIFSPKTPSIVP